MYEIFSRKFVLYNIKCIYLHRVFHGIRFKVNNEDWLSVKMAFFFFMAVAFEESALSNEKSGETYGV